MYTEKDLSKFKALNLVGIGGFSNSIPNVFSKTGYASVLNSLKENDRDIPELGGFGWMVISALKNWQLDLFEYENLPAELPAAEIEKLLFWWGRGVIFKIGEKFYVSTFSTNKYDFYWFPKEITPIAPNPTSIKIKKMSVDNASIIFNDNSFLFNRVNLFGTLFKVWASLGTLIECHNLIKRNLVTSKQFIKMPVNTSQKNIDIMNSIMYSQNLIIPMSNTFSTSIKNRGQNDELQMSFDDKTGSVWDNYYNSWDIICNFLGIPSNANPKKRERQITDEIKVNNQFSNSQINSMLKARENWVNDLNQKFNLNVKVTLKQEKNDILEQDEYITRKEQNE